MSSLYYDGYLTPYSHMGIRNHTVVYATDGLCVNIAEKINNNVKNSILLYHPYGRGQIGDDKRWSQTITDNILTHPNVSGVVLVGFDQNDLNTLEALIKDHNKLVASIPIYQSGDRTSTIQKGMEATAEIVHKLSGLGRCTLPLNEMNIGLIFDPHESNLNLTIIKQVAIKLNEMGVKVFTSENNWLQDIRDSLDLSFVSIIEGKCDTQEETITLLSSAHCHLFLNFHTKWTSGNTVVPIIQITFCDEAVGSDIRLNPQTSEENFIEKIIQKLLSVASGEKTYSEILGHAHLWYSRIEPSI